MKFIIISTEYDKPKVLNSDISPKMILESQANGHTITVYKTDQVREVKKMSNDEAVKFLEQKSVQTGYSTTYPTNFRDAGI